MTEFQSGGCVRSASRKLLILLSLMSVSACSSVGNLNAGNAKQASAHSSAMVDTAPLKTEGDQLFERGDAYRALDIYLQACELKSNEKGIYYRIARAALITRERELGLYSIDRLAALSPESSSDTEIIDLKKQLELLSHTRLVTTNSGDPNLFIIRVRLCREICSEEGDNKFGPLDANGRVLDRRLFDGIDLNNIKKGFDPGVLSLSRRSADSEIEQSDDFALAGDQQSALKAILEADSLDPDRPEVYWRIAISSALAGQYTISCASLESLLIVKPDAAERGDVTVLVNHFEAMVDRLKGK